MRRMANMKRKTLDSTWNGNARKEKTGRVSVARIDVLGCRSGTLWCVSSTSNVSITLSGTADVDVVPKMSSAALYTRVSTIN